MSPPHVSLIVNPITQILFIPKSKSYINEYFTIVALEDGLTAKLSTNACEYRIDNGSWNTLSADTNTPSINTGQTLSFRGNLTPKLSSGSGLVIAGIGTFTINKSFNVEGNIMSLLFGDDFADKNDLTGYNYAFYNLFKKCTTLQNAENLILPATKLVDSCYGYMFTHCTSLTTAPELPATTLACYCYQGMFSLCTSLITAPVLPATKLVDGCYANMFDSCSKLNNITMLARNTIATQPLYYWVLSVANTGIFVKLPDMTALPSNLPSNSIHGIPKGWTVKNYNVPTPSVINLTKNNDISFYYTDGLFTPTNDYIQLTQHYSEQQILSFKPQCDIIVDIYTKDNDTVRESIEWSMDMTLSNLINGLGIDNIDNIAIMIRSLYIPESDSYGYYN